MKCKETELTDYTLEIDLHDSPFNVLYAGPNVALLSPQIQRGSNEFALKMIVVNLGLTWALYSN